MANKLRGEVYEEQVRKQQGQAGNNAESPPPYGEQNDARRSRDDATLGEPGGAFASEKRAESDTLSVPRLRWDTPLESSVFCFSDLC